MKYYDTFVYESRDDNPEGDVRFYKIEMFRPTYIALALSLLGLLLPCMSFSAAILLVIARGWMDEFAGQKTPVELLRVFVWACIINVLAITGDLLWIVMLIFENA